MSQNFLPGGFIPIEEVSPFILHLLYSACIILSKLQREYKVEDTKSLTILQEALRVLTHRWLASRKSLLSPICIVLGPTNTLLEQYLNILAARSSMLEI